MNSSEKDNILYRIEKYISWYRWLDNEINFIANGTQKSGNSNKDSSIEFDENQLEYVINKKSLYEKYKSDFIRPFYVDHEFETDLEENEYLKGQLFDSFQKLYEYGGLELIDELIEKKSSKDNDLNIPLIFNFIYQDNFYDPWYFYSYTWAGN